MHRWSRRVGEASLCGNCCGGESVDGSTDELEAAIEGSPYDDVVRAGGR